MLRISASPLLGHALDVSLAVDARWKFAVLAGIATLATLVLLALTLRSLRRDELVRASGQRHDRRRRSTRGRPDARAALALVGDALAATHNPRALVPVILDVVAEATGARGARIFRDGEELGWIGEPGGRNELRLDLSAEDEPTRTELVLYPPSEGFTAETRQLAEWLAAQAGIALENARLHDLVQRQAITDDLTGLVNRRRFLAVLDTEVERAAQLGSGLGLVLIDLDDFKDVNDRFGHHSGDRVLAAFGSLLQEHIRDVDLAARLGGEEFALLLPEVEGRDSVLVAERLRRSLSERPIAWVEGNALSSTASFGVAQYRQGDTGEDLLRLADDALYRAKGEGKNRVCVAPKGRAA
jgi:diguanylate cyclase (GGDEF)-like protein